MTFHYYMSEAEFVTLASLKVPSGIVHFFLSFLASYLPSFLEQNRFTSLSLALGTDRLTLWERLDLQRRRRDTAEENMGQEIRHLQEGVEVGEKRHHQVGGGRVFKILSLSLCVCLILIRI